MNLQQLYYFQAISRLKNYTKAAEQLLVAQSSLSHSIGDLERELGVPLFFKVGRNIDITEYGKQFLIHVDRITAELELANQELKNMLNPNMGKIRIALAYTVSNRFIPNMIKGFYENEDNRAIQFEFSEKQAAKIIDAFANRTLDLGFGARMDSDQLEYFHIFDEEIVAVVSSRHPLALRGSVKLQDLIREPMVSYTYNCGTRYWIDDVFRRFQLTPNIIQEVDTEKVMASAVASGLGVALMPRMTELSIYDVVPLTLENSELHRPMFMCWPKGETLLVVNIFLLFVGMVMDAAPAILILTPILAPVMTAIGVDMVHFGIMMVVNLAVGFVTPPVGINLFVASSMTKIPVIRIAKVSLPFTILFAIGLVLIVIFPQISLCLIR